MTMVVEPGAALAPGEAVAALAAGVDGVLGAPWWRVSDAGVRDAVVEVERQAAWLEAARLRLLAEADARSVGAGVGAPSTGEWFAAATLARRESATERVHRAQALNSSLAVTGAALATGGLSGEHAAVICRAMTRLPRGLDPQTLFQAEEFLVEQAGVLDPRRLARVGAVLRSRLNTDAGAQAAGEEDTAVNQAEFTLVQDDDGRWHLHGTLDPVGGATLAAAVDALSAPAPAAGGTPDSRPARQRRASALVHLADTWLATRTGGTPSSRPRLTLTVPLATVLDPAAAGAAPGLLTGGHPVSPTTLAELACDAEVVPVLTDGAGSPLDVGRTVYAFPDRIRTAITTRDTGCTFPGCTRPAPWCHLHHLRSYREGGATSERNGTLLCGFHHRLVHRTGWRGQLRGAQVIWHPPDQTEPTVPPPPWAPALDRLIHHWRQRCSLRTPPAPPPDTGRVRPARRRPATPGRSRKADLRTTG